MWSLAMSASGFKASGLRMFGSGFKVLDLGG